MILACILATTGRRSLSVGPSSPVANEKSLSKMANFCTLAARLVDLSFTLFIALNN